MSDIHDIDEFPEQVFLIAVKIIYRYQKKYHCLMPILNTKTIKEVIFVELIILIILLIVNFLRRVLFYPFS